MQWLQEITSRPFKVPPAEARASTLQPGDEGFVIRRVTRREQDWKLPFDPAVMEFGLLRCEGPPPTPPPAQRRASPARKKA